VVQFLSIYYQCELMGAVNEADLFAQAVSGYEHVIMLHCGLGLVLAVAELLTFLTPLVHRLKVLLALCPSLCLPKFPLQWI
jgi:hypothetical protein